ncbi:HNH endonuclease [Parageobacillus toebii]|uniref:HNH endonuclease n=1 Tax=Parageobacillus toebii TaxID=153151 RepID=UPI0035C6C7D9
MELSDKVIIKKSCRNCGNFFVITKEDEKDIDGREVVWCSESCKSQLHLCECKKCLKEFFSKYSHSKYCSEECKQENCLVCNKLFVPTSKLKFHCSDRCKEIYYTHTCVVCGEEFYREQKSAKFCSSECRTAFYEVRRTARNNICKNCKRVFAFLDSSADFCSAECRIEYVSKQREKRKFNWEDEQERRELYQLVKSKVEILLHKREQLINERIISTVNFWGVDGFTQSLSEKIKQRDGYACYVCEDTKTLEVHHILPRKLGGSHSEDNLVTLCTKCHRAIETGNKEHAIKKCFSKALTVLGAPPNPKSKTKDVLLDTNLVLNSIYKELAEKNGTGEFEEILIKLDDILDEIQPLL